VSTLWRWARPMYRDRNPCTLLLRSALNKKEGKKQKRRNYNCTAMHDMYRISRSIEFLVPSFPTFFSGHFFPFFSVHLEEKEKSRKSAEEKEKIRKKPTAHHACHPRVNPFHSLPGGNLPLLRGSDSSHATKEIQDACRGLGIRV
jgi:hypothetical protein